MNQILLVEDDPSLGESLKSFLVKEGFNIDWVQQLSEARKRDLMDYSLVILDWMLPDGQGIDFLKEIKEKNIGIPVLMLTARVDLIDKVLGLESGANDYLTKPFEPRELLARVRVQMRTSHKIEEITLLEFSELRINLERREVLLQESAVEMTKMEFNLLTLLAGSPGRAFSREEILNKVWGFESYPSTRTVDTHILQLRQKIGDNYFQTIRGIGYKFNA
ncbi:MAG: response regulator transcription factor [Bacteriovoracaceae bacterium]|nr:response regulator transcription factor [Bacteriovoracaceae bacterium]